MASIITAIGNALQPAGTGRLLPDGRLVFTPRHSPNGPDPLAGEPRYMTPRQRVLLGWSKLPWALIPVMFVAFLAQTGGTRRRIDFGDVGDVALVAAFLIVWLLLAASFLVAFRIGSRIEKEQYYEPGD